MNPDLHPLLRCPTCVKQQAEHLLTLEIIKQDAPNEQHINNKRIWEATLTCPLCNTVYPVREGIPRFVDLEKNSLQAKIATNFGDSWQLYAESNERKLQNKTDYETGSQHRYAETTPKIHPYTLDQFLDWIEPLTANDFKDKLVLDLGCGLGGFTDFSAMFGASKVVGLEISHAVDSCVQLLHLHPNLDLVQANLLEPPFAPQTFDLVYSIGVLHHLPKPRLGFDSAARMRKSDGELFIWVYGKEHNEFVVYIVDPLRKLMCLLPVWLVRQCIALPLAFILYPLLHTLYHPALKALGQNLPYYDYFQWLRRYGFSYTKGMITDQLIPPETHYHSKPELEGWYAENGLEVDSITNRNHISWRVLGSSKSA